MSLSDREKQLDSSPQQMPMEPISWPAANQSWLPSLKKGSMEVMTGVTLSWSTWENKDAYMQGSTLTQTLWCYVNGVYNLTQRQRFGNPVARIKYWHCAFQCQLFYNVSNQAQITCIWADFHVRGWKGWWWSDHCRAKLYWSERHLSPTVT